MVLRILAAGIGALLLAIGFASPAVAQQTNVVPVWATAGGNAPLGGAVVRVLQGHHMLRENDRTRVERTSPSGVSLMSFARVPRDFTVQVTPRGRLGGSLKAIVHGYRPGDVVFVNPVTTMAADITGKRARGGKQIGPAQARRDVDRVLGIPSWETDDDLRLAADVLDGRRYLRAARKAGGIAALDRALEEAAASHGSRHLFRGGAGVRAPMAQAAAVGAAFERVFTELRTFAGAVGGPPTIGANLVLGWLLAGFGFGQGGPNSEVADIKTSLAALSTQVRRVEGNVALASFSSLYHETNGLIGQIDTAWRDLEALANIPFSDTERKAFTAQLTQDIARLRDVPATLALHLNPALPLADNVIKAASRTLSTRNRFFDAASSDTVKGVYDYYAAAQAKLAILLTEYYHAENVRLPVSVYPPAYITRAIDGIEAQVSQQAISLKPRVPDNTVIDTETGLMWARDFGTVQLKGLVQLVPRGGLFDLELIHFAVSAGVPNLPFGNWAVASADELNRLVSNRDKNALEWLGKDAHMSPSLIDATQSHFWTRDTFRQEKPHFYGGYELCYYLYSLQLAGLAARTCKPIVNDSDRNATLGIRQGAFFERRPARDEEYWWR
jgi:hypothetical protein